VVAHQSWELADAGSNPAILTFSVRVAQVEIRAPRYERGGREFESLHGHAGWLAQQAVRSVEARTDGVRVLDQPFFKVM
jgi:hypothetical protein